VRALLLLSLFLAGCGKEAVPTQYDLGACGGVDQRCCPGDTCAAGDMCVSGFCQVIVCGHSGERCCTTGGCDVSLACIDGICSTSCGNSSEPCCTGDQCTDPATDCVAGTCQFHGLPSGAACSTGTDCAGDDATCGDPSMWPGGYCLASCDISVTDLPTGHNPTCPGDQSVCVRTSTAEGACMAGCTAMNGALPCRPGYSCFERCEFQSPCAHACLPSSLSQCDPTAPGGCGVGMDCLRAGLDVVGACATRCNVFAQDCAQTNGPMTCTVFDDTGTGVCTPAKGGTAQGGGCVVNSDCLQGLTCFQQLPAYPSCRPFCGGPMNVPCHNGKKCIDFSTALPLAVVGICDG
jgi:hypothetical protein